MLNCLEYIDLYTSYLNLVRSFANDHPHLAPILTRSYRKKSDKATLRQLVHKLNDLGTIYLTCLTGTPPGPNLTFIELLNTTHKDIEENVRLTQEEDDDLGRTGSPPGSAREHPKVESRTSEAAPPPRADTRTEEIIETVPEELKEEEDYSPTADSKVEAIRVREADMSMKESSFTTKGTMMKNGLLTQGANSRKKRKRSASKKREQEMIEEIAKLRKSSVEQVEAVMLLKKVILDLEERTTGVERGVIEKDVGLQAVGDSVRALEHKINFYETKGRVSFHKNFDGPLKQMEELRQTMQREYKSALDGLASFKHLWQTKMKSTEVKYDEIKGKVDVLNHSFKDRLGGLVKGEEFFK